MLWLLCIEFSIIFNFGTYHPISPTSNNNSCQTTEQKIIVVNLNNFINNKHHWFTYIVGPSLFFLSFLLSKELYCLLFLLSYFLNRVSQLFAHHILKFTIGPSIYWYKKTLKFQEFGGKETAIKDSLHHCYLIASHGWYVQYCYLKERQLA